MCGRYTLARIEEMAERFSYTENGQEIKARYNAAPSQNMPLVLKNDGRLQMKMMQWGLLPFWAKGQGGNRFINARWEGLEEKASFKYALRERRCLVPADGYYEWQKTSSGKQPLRITMPDGELFAFAGLWEKWSGPAGEPLLTFTIVTTAALPSLTHIHHRMPFILRPEQEGYWLNGFSGGDAQTARSFLNRLKPAGNLIAYPVSKRVNSPKNDDPLCAEPVD